MKIFPLVSIILPNYNHAKYIGACLDLIMFQDYPNIELVIIDDASTDNSKDVINNFLQSNNTEMVSFASYYNDKIDKIERTTHFRYPQTGREIIYIINERNMGSTATYNIGFKLAKGEFCTFVATDDICHQQFISASVQALQKNKADFVYSDMFIIDDNNRILREFKLPDYDFKKCFCDWYLCGVATLYRKKLHELYGYYNENAYADDHECYLRFAKNNAKFVHIPKTLYSVRSHENRKVGLHEPDNFNKLLGNSKELAMIARSLS